MNRPFRFGVTAAFAQSHADWTALARRAEELGYSTLLIPDRTTIGSFSPLTALAIAAEATTTLRVGSYVFCNEYRHPVILAREAATLDLLSEGRFELGLGAGVSSFEFQQMGIPFASAGTRVERLAESIQIMKRLFTEETVSFEGKHYAISEMKGQIRPVQKPHLPILVAGIGERMLKLAAREANSVAVGFKWTRQGADPTDATIEQKIAWIRQAAGERFADLELCQSIYDIAITDSGADIPFQAGMPPMPKRLLSTEQAIEQLQEQRARYGFSYLQISQAQVENFAPVVARLAGK
jgi:probable F420-dependent oxidoreductase